MNRKSDSRSFRQRSSDWMIRDESSDLEVEDRVTQEKRRSRSLQRELGRRDEGKAMLQSSDMSHHWTDESTMDGVAFDLKYDPI